MRTRQLSAAACCLLVLAAAASATLAAGPSGFISSLAGQVEDRQAWLMAPPISSFWMHVPDNALPAGASLAGDAAAAAAAAAAAPATIEIGQLGLKGAQPRMLAQTAVPRTAAAPAPAPAAAQKCIAHSKDMNQHTKDGYKLHWKAFSDKCSAACRKQAIIRVPDGVYQVYCSVPSCTCTLVNDKTKMKHRRVKLEYTATRARDGAYVAAFVVQGELYPTAKACKDCAGRYSFCNDC